MVLNLFTTMDNTNSTRDAYDSNYLTSSSTSSNNESCNSCSKSRSVSRQNSTISHRSNIVNPVLNFSLNTPNSAPIHLNRIFSNADFDDQIINSSSLTHIVNNDEFNRENPTSEYYKYEMFKKHITIILSCIYAVFIVTLGLVIYILDILVDDTAMAETFSIYLLIIGFVYILYLVIDIRIYLNKSKTPTTNNRQEWRENNSIQLSIFNSHTATPSIEQQPHHYCFAKGRHSGSFYLKIGAAGFCLGHLIHSGLLLGYQIVFLTSDGDAFYECASVATLVLDITYPIYSFVLLYFIFKYSNVIINKRIELGRFALMHCIASSLCFWVWTILRETMDSFTHHSIQDKDKDYNPANDKISAIPFQVDDDEQQPHAESLTSYTKYGAKELVKFLNGTSSKIGTSCKYDSRMNFIYENYSPYLYPFTVEYSILVVGVLFIIWQNIGSCHSNTENKTNNNVTSFERKYCPMPGPNKENGFASNIVINVDCHSASTGLFAGILILVSTIVSIFLFFIALSNPKYVSHGIIVNSITELVFLILMTISSVIAYRKIMRLDINYHPVSLLDDLLLFVCIPAFFLNAIFSIIPAVQKENAISIVIIVLQIIQVLIQTPLIIDGLRRCSNSRDLRLQKPGRGLVTFLVVCNVATWITETFEIKSRELTDSRTVFYGEIWTIIDHFTVPLTMFYRFHSSVCLVDIWQSAYEPANI